MIQLLDSSPEIVSGVGEKYLDILKSHRYTSVYDLLTHFPEFYIDSSKTDDKIEYGFDKVYLVKITRSNLYRNYRKKLSVINISGTIGNNEIDIVIFNKPYLMDMIRNSEILKVYGKIKTKGSDNRMENPRILKEEEGIIPVYKSIGNIRSGSVRNIIENIFKLNDADDDILPGYIVKKYGFRNFWESLKSIHTPCSLSKNIDELHKRYIYTEFLLFQLEIAFIRERSGKIRRNNFYPEITDLEKFVSDNVKFKLTIDQRKSVNDIFSDLKSGNTMQRLLLGDVGSGKTIISFLFLLIAVMNGYQGAFLAPTEVLISQHFENAGKFFNGLRIAILTGSSPAAERRQIIRDLKKGKISVIFGTHSLINENIIFSDLSAIVIDEQHRFGVAQRAALFYKGEKADLLVTTATPIPRTLLLSLYKDLDVSEIKSLPEGRIPVETFILKRDIREKFYKEIKQKITEGGKVFIVLPLISRSSRFPDLRSLESETLFFKKVFKGIPFRIISGKTHPDERRSIFRKFSGNLIRILISTTVIEVGIDVRDATIIIIEDADKFGLSQLHQLRGRVGRGEKKSYCYLFPSSRITPGGRERLKILRETPNGFEIAEKDLGMRGGGNIAGLEQSGYLDFRISDIKEFPDIYINASKDARKIIGNKNLQNIHIRRRLDQIELGMRKISFS